MELNPFQGCQPQNFVTRGWLNTPLLIVICLKPQIYCRPVCKEEIWQIKQRLRKTRHLSHLKIQKVCALDFFSRMVSYYNLLYLSVKLVKANITTTTDLKQRWVDLS